MSRRDKYIRAALMEAADRLEELQQAIEYAISHAGNHYMEWGERAEKCFEILEDAIKPVEVEPVEVEPVEVEPKVGDWCMFRDYESTNWDGPWKLVEIRNPDHECRYRHRNSFWKQCRKATPEEIAKE
jgi:hypothetical protein